MRWVYRNTGTGYACAKHKSEIVELTSRSKRLVLESLENTGALEPIGSEIIFIKYV